ncbi:MAG: heavy metal-responsive transcriptional regulator [Thiomonas sp.]|uniref:heavy metal-responsive transcriptional regulator n=1 Tax=Thiomonas sp. TaxID=2047785 RepID=UPI002A371674|nr:heavy metal-responsive transcriptional regulator [Thiomonas sp.]MDY0329279.1 heavy metal-responsive transcriptional regulator [Thiomonas sp.]
MSSLPSPDPSRLTIGELAQRAQLGAETLRYYERLGLLEPAQRTASGYRLYAPQAVERLDFIRRAQALGFSLAQIGELLALHARPEADMGAVRAIAAQRLAEIDAKIDDLQRMKQGLQTLLDACPGHGATKQCPILASLRGEKENVHE